MFDDDEQPVRKALFSPPDLSDFSVDELRHYKSTLQEEIARIEVDIDKKSSYADQLNSFFKD